jgi:putative effector of murein hydrolase
MNELLHSQSFGIMLTLLFYVIANYIYKKTKITLLNPLMVSSIFVICYIKLFNVNTEEFLTDLSGINVFLGPLIICLAIPIAKNRELIKKNLLPIIVGSFVGAITTVIVVIVLGNVLGMDEVIIASVIPKSTTTPFAIEISNKLGGIRAITVAVVIISAVIGTIIIPFLAKLFKVTDPLLIGMSLGSTSHAVGTSKAMEMDPTAGAIAGVALVVSGLATVIITMFL